MVFNYGWEWETCELGFILIFLCSPPTCFLKHWGKYGREKGVMGPPTLLIFLYRWTAFRFLLGAGMSKCGEWSSDCWFDLTCTSYHYFTQPIPNMFAYYMHRL